MGYEPSPNILTTPFAELAPIIEDGTVASLIKTALQQNLVYEGEFAERREWMVNMGQTLTIPRDAPLPPIDQPSDPNEDPEYQKAQYEETLASVSPYKAGLKVDMLTNAATIRDYFANRVNALGRQAANSLNAIRRKSLYSTYLGGHAIALETENADTTIRVNSINGFRRQINADGKWLAVSADNPKPIMIGAGTFALVIGVAADEPNPKTGFPDGRGTLTLAAPVSWVVNDPVVAMDAPYRVYQGGGVTNDAISTTDKLNLESVRLAIAMLEENGVPRHEDGTFWVHMGPFTKPQLWADPEFQNVIRGGVETSAFENYVLYRCMGCTFVDNQQTPNRANAGGLQNSRIATTAGKLSKSIYAEIVNRDGVELAHTIVTGGGLGMTWWMNQNRLKSPAGLNANEFYGMTVAADNMSIIVDNMVRFLIAAPTDDMRQNVPANWQWIGSFMCWNDFFGGTYSPLNDPLTTRNPYYKRAVPITHSAR